MKRKKKACGASYRHADTVEKQVKKMSDRRKQIEARMCCGHATGRGGRVCAGAGATTALKYLVQNGK